MNMYRNFNKVRKSIFHLMLGRLVMTVSAIMVALMVVRGLSIAEFGQYVALMGLMLVVAMMSDAGIGRIQPRFLPELYIQKDSQGVVRLIRLLLGVRVLLHGLFWLTLFLLFSLWSEALDIQIGEDLLLVFIGFAFFYALNQQTQRTLQVLLLQKVATQLIALEWLLKLIILSFIYEGPDSFVLMDVYAVQALSVVVSFVVGQLVLQQKSKRLLQGELDVKTGCLDVKKVVHFGWKNWVQTLLGVPISPGAVRVFMAAIAGSVSVAYLGFAYTMMQLLQRILPSKMIVQAIEPVYIARYRESGDFSELNGMVSLVLKLNYFILIPVLVWFALGSYAALDWVSSGKYADSGWIIAALIFIFMFENHRMALQVLSNAVDQSMLLVKSNMLAIILLPLYVLASIYWGLQGLLLGLIVISWARNWYLVSHLRKQGFNYQQDWKNLNKMIALAALSALCMYFVLQLVTGLVASILAALVVMIVFYGIGLKIHFFKTKERELINKTVGKNLFFW